MITQGSVYLNCDEKKCAAQMTGNDEDSLRLRAARSGWLVAQGPRRERDYCPKCAINRKDPSHAAE